MEHDLSVLDYLSDFICCLYGVPGAYGVVTMPFSVREGECSCRGVGGGGGQFTVCSLLSFCVAGINIFLDGFVPTENLRFRESSLVFKVTEQTDELEAQKLRRYNYPDMSKLMGSFKLTVEKGNFTDSEIIVMLGENGTGKTTFIRMLAGLLKPDSGG